MRLVPEKHVRDYLVREEIESRLELIELSVVRRDANFPSGPRQQIDHARLMLQRHQGDDIASRRHEGACVQAVIQTREVL